MVIRIMFGATIFVPIIERLGRESFGLESQSDLLPWFGVLYLVNMEVSFLSPPFGYALFYSRGVAPPEMPMVRIFKATSPFLTIQVIGLAACILFSSIITWLPNLVHG